ncbi:MAG TPA: DUF2837 family protein [Pyrinomonadaceae bacterium]|nr:DUF2837 family protein [Pyrinomonadaceae bacterium]
MSAQVAAVFALTFAIHMTGTLSYALRLAGVSTGRIAVAFSLTNLLLLVSRTSNTFQAPLLAKHVEGNILRGTLGDAEWDFRVLMLAGTLATVVGGLLLPTAQTLFADAIVAFGRHRSIPRLVLRALTPVGLRHAAGALRAPSWRGVAGARLTGTPLRMAVFNALATALLTVNVFASLYAGCLSPELRLTANNLSPIVNGLSTILLFVYIDPYLSVLTDDVLAGREGESFFRKCVVLFVCARLAGTLLAQLLLLPAAQGIIIISKLL